MTTFSTVSYDDFMPLVYVEAAGVPAGAARNAIRAACIEFCETTNFWRHTLPPITAVANQQEYLITGLPVGTRLTSVLSVTDTNLPVWPKTAEWLDEFCPGWKSAAGSRAQWYTVPMPGSLLITPMHAQDDMGALVVTVALKPARSSTTVLDLLYEDYQEAIVAGALWRLQMIANKAWTNPEGAMVNLEKFKALAGGAKIDVAKGHTKRSGVVKPRAFGF